MANMKPRKRNAERTKAAIIAAARRLFAERGIATVSIRDIAKAARVSHGLVQQYFGTRKRLIAAIIRREIDSFHEQAALPEAIAANRILGGICEQLQAGMPAFRDYALLITRAELAGLKPEKMLDPTVPTPAMTLATVIQELQSKAPDVSDRLDPRLVSAYINASLFAFAVLSPWLMTSVGLKPDDYEARSDELAEISMRLIALTCEAPSSKT